MSTNTVTTFFALLAFVCNAFVIVVIGAALLRRWRPHIWDALVELVGPTALTLAAVIAVVATAGSLYLSEVAHFTPCTLCWYQRIGMYPLAVILVIAAARRDTRVWMYPFTLALIALPISIYHVLLERFPTLETGACDIANPCSIVWVRHFGVVTIPYMAASGFAAIATALVLAARWQAKEQQHAEANEASLETRPSTTPSDEPDVRHDRRRDRAGRYRRDRVPT